MNNDIGDEKCYTEERILTGAGCHNAGQKSYLYQPHKTADCSKSDSPSNEQNVLIFWFRRRAFDVEISPSAWALKTSLDI